MATQHVLFYLLMAVIGVAYCHEYNIEELRTNASHASRIITTRMNCRIGDQFCNIGCGELVICIADNELFVIENCTQTVSTPTCDSASLSCMTTEQAVCDKRFPCHAEGMFPNPIDCHTYYMCAQAQGYGVIHTCPEDDANEYGYDPLTNLCRMSREDRVCRENPVKYCIYDAQTGAQRENPNMYHICVRESTGILVPWMFRCDKGYEIYDENTKRCTAFNTTTMPTTNTSTTEPTTAPTTAPTTIEFGV